MYELFGSLNITAIISKMLDDPLVTYQHQYNIKEKFLIFNYQKYETDYYLIRAFQSIPFRTQAFPCFLCTQEKFGRPVDYVM